jgi:hypothetical protein
VRWIAPGGSLNTWSDDDPSRGQWWRPLWPAPTGWRKSWLSTSVPTRIRSVDSTAGTKHARGDNIPSNMWSEVSNVSNPAASAPFAFRRHSFLLGAPQIETPKRKGRTTYWKSSLHGCTLRRENAGPQPLKSGIPSHGKNVSTKCWLSHRLTPEHHRADPEHHLSSGSIRRGINRWLRSTASQSRAALPTQSGPMVRRTVWEMALNSTLGTPSGLRVRSTLVPTNNPPEKM